MIAAVFLTFPADDQGNQVSINAGLVVAYRGYRSINDMSTYVEWTTVTLYGAVQQVDCRVSAEEFGRKLGEALTRLTVGTPTVSASLGPAR